VRSDNTILVTCAINFGSHNNTRYKDGIKNINKIIVRKKVGVVKITN
jgi:hypothetical protein